MKKVFLALVLGLLTIAATGCDNEETTIEVSNDTVVTDHESQKESDYNIVKDWAEPRGFWTKGGRFSIIYWREYNDDYIRVEVYDSEHDGKCILQTNLY